MKFSKLKEIAKKSIDSRLSKVLLQLLAIFRKNATLVKEEKEKTSLLLADDSQEAKTAIESEFEIINFTFVVRRLKTLFHLIICLIRDQKQQQRNPKPSKSNQIIPQTIVIREQKNSERKS